MAAAQPNWIPATVLYREIGAQGYRAEVYSTDLLDERLSAQGTRLCPGAISKGTPQ